MEQDLEGRWVLYEDIEQERASDGRIIAGLQKQRDGWRGQCATFASVMGELFLAIAHGHDYEVVLTAATKAQDDLVKAGILPAK